MTTFGPDVTRRIARAYRRLQDGLSIAMKTASRWGAQVESDGPGCRKPNREGGPDARSVESLPPTQILLMAQPASRGRLESSRDPPKPLLQLNGSDGGRTLDCDPGDRDRI